MNVHLLKRAPRNANLGTLHLTFFVAAIVTELCIRTQLYLTHYPQLGGHGLHIAHLLWGGLFMVVALAILLSLLGRRARQVAALIAGVGFGFFVDELGKFITADNNYFFKPAAALIYIIFICLFLLVRRLNRGYVPSPGERLANAIDLVADAARRQFDEHEKQRALGWLRGAEEAGPLADWIRRVVSELEALPPSAPPLYARWAAAVRRRYFALVERTWFPLLVDCVFGLWAILSLLTIIELVFSVAFHWGGAMGGFRRDELAHLPFVNWADLVSSAVSAVLVFAGLVELHRSGRLPAYRLFKDALLVSIFVTRVFAFVESQFGAVFGLAVDLVLLVTVRYMIEQERRAEERAGPERPRAGVAAEYSPAAAP